MPRKSKYAGGAKKKFVEVGTKLFFENGFEGTSIRNITDEADCEVGLFYYYYNSKDQLFDEVIDSFFEPYRQDFEEIATEAESNPDKPLFKFFAYMKREVILFREKYAKNMHKTVRWAIREHALTLIEPYIERIIVKLVEEGAKPRMDAHAMAIFLSHGIGSVILHEDAEWVASVTDELRKTVNLLMGLTEEEAEKMFSPEE